MFYRNLVENEKDLIYTVNETGNIVYVNPMVENITGYSENELIGMQFCDLHRQDYKDITARFISQQLYNKTATTYFETPLITKYGKHVWIGQSITSQITDKGTQLTIVARDITDKISTDSNIHKKNSKHAVLIENLQIGVLVEDEHSKIAIVNQAFCNMFRIRIHPDDLIGKEYKLVNQFILQLIKHGTPHNHIAEPKRMSDVIELLNGNVYERDQIPLYYDKDYNGTIWKYRDITEKNNIKRELAKNERKYKSIIETMKLGLLEVDNDGYITSANESFCKMLSYKSINDLIGKKAIDTLLDEESQKIMQTQITLREQSASGAYEIKIKKANGVDSAWVMIAGTPLFDDDNKVIGSMGIHLDVTLQKQIAEELQEARLIESHLEAQKKALELLEEKVKERTSEVLRQKQFIENKNTEITMSLNYALRIQQALLPSKKKMRKTLSASFILFKPKDIVSGDFYFYNKKNDRVIIAAADCTGHGVPGAFMSMLGSEKLLNAVHKGGRPGEILSALDRSIKNSLHHDDNEKSILDGLDISICSIDLGTNIVEFAGAHRPFWMIRKDEPIPFLEEIKGANRDIGGWSDETEFFDTHTIQLYEGDTFYLCTDGFADQFGNNNKRMKTRRLKEKLLSIQHLSMEEQEIELKRFFEEWKGAQEQTDDVLMIGIKIV